MSEDPDRTRRWLINASGAALISNAFAPAPSFAQAAPASRPEEHAMDDVPISPITTALSEYVTRSLDRELPPAVAAKTKMHVLDTIAAMVSGSRLKPGQLAATYVDSLGGRPQATVIGTGIVTSSVNAALANGMAAHGDETDDFHLAGRFHPGCGIVPAALATAEAADSSGSDLLRAVALGYDIGARSIFALGFRTLYTERHSTHSLSTTFGATAAAAALLRLNPREVRHAFSFAAQQASGIPYWERDREHVEKAFDFGGMGARNGVTAATMIRAVFTGVDDFLSGDANLFTALGDEGAKPAELVAELGTRYEVMNTSIKKWCVGSPLQSVLDAVTALLEDPLVRAGAVKARCRRHAGRSAAHRRQPHHPRYLPPAPRRAGDRRRRRDLRERPRLRAHERPEGAPDPGKLVEAVPSKELQTAKPARQAIVRIETADGRTLAHRTYEVRGTPGNPMDKSEVDAKALDLTRPILGASRVTNSLPPSAISIASARSPACVGFCRHSAKKANSPTRPPNRRSRCARGRASV